MTKVVFLSVVPVEIVSIVETVITVVTFNKSN